jgi:hypothetical protein
VKDIVRGKKNNPRRIGDASTGFSASATAGERGVFDLLVEYLVKAENCNSFGRMTAHGHGRNEVLGV